VWRVTLVDGGTVVVKSTDYDAHLEAEGLDALRSAGGPTPEVLGVDDRVLVLEHVTGPGDLRQLGAAVAGVHATTGPSFGWHRDNVIGPLPQVNTGGTDWAAFYTEHRLVPYLDDLPPELADRLRRAIERGQVAAVLEHDAVPSLVHGDLWSGNVVGDRWLVDPAVHQADRELDLAMLALFGTIPPPFLRGYTEAWPLDDGWRRRRPALQLYHLLVHVRLFGAGYVGSVASRLDELDW
jgi:fructosamine-3-kinase